MKRVVVKPSEIIAGIYDRIDSAPLAPVWISLVPRETALARAHELEADPEAAEKALYGLPFAITIAGLSGSESAYRLAYMDKR